MKINIISKKQILFLLNILLALLIMGFTIYRRLIVIRLPKSLFIFNDTVDYLSLNTVIIGFSISLFCLYQSLHYFFTKNNREYKLFTKLGEIIENAILELYKWFCNQIPNIYRKVSLIAEIFYVLFHKHVECFLLLIMYFIRLIIVISFLIDIFIFFKFDYFYKSLYLLCISLFIKILIYLLRDFSLNLEEVKLYLNIEDGGIDPETQLPITFYSLKDDCKDLNLDFCIKQYILCSKLTGYLRRYDLYANVFAPYFNLILYSLYFIGWSYIILFNIIELF
jgi:hypothetical protein